MSTISPRKELLLTASLSAQGAALPVSREVDFDGIDEDFFVRQATAHGVGAFVYAALRAANSPGVAAAVAAKLQRVALATAQKNHDFADELIRVHDAFSDAGIAAVPFKGLALAQLLYDGISLRYGSDIDIFIPENQIASAERILEKQGYEFVPPRVENHFERTYHSRERRVTLELHWAFSDGTLGFTVPDNWNNNLVELEIREKRLKTFSREATLVLLAVNGYREFWRRLGGVLDVAVLLRDEKLNVHEALDIARAIDHETAFYIALFLAREIFMVDLPPAIAGAIEKNSLSRGISRRLAARLLAGVDVFPAWTHHLTDPLVRRRWKHRRDILGVPLIAFRRSDRDTAGALARPARLLRSYGGEFLSILRKK